MQHSLYWCTFRSCTIAIKHRLLNAIFPPNIYNKSMTYLQASRKRGSQLKYYSEFSIVILWRVARALRKSRGL